MRAFFFRLGTMLHHISIGVSDIERSGVFYDEVLGRLGYRRVWQDIRPGERHQAIGYGIEDGKDKFTLKERHSAPLAPGQGFHLAFEASSRAAVDAFHASALNLGATDRGGPKLWSEFGENYYAAFVVDPDGWQLEAVCKTPD